MKKLSERAVVVVHPVMENALRAGMEGSTFQTYQLVLPRMVGMSIHDPSDSAEERDRVKFELLDYVKSTILDDVEIMSAEKYEKLRDAEKIAEDERRASMLR